MEESVLDHRPTPNGSAVLRHKETDRHQLQTVGLEGDHPLLIIEIWLGIRAQSRQQRHAWAIDIGIEDTNTQAVLRHSNRKIVGRRRFTHAALARGHAKNVLCRSGKLRIGGLAPLRFTLRLRLCLLGLLWRLRLGLCGGDDLRTRHTRHSLHGFLDCGFKWREGAGAVGRGFEDQSDQSFILYQALHIAGIKETLSVWSLDAVQYVAYLIKHNHSHQMKLSSQ